MEIIIAEKPSAAKKISEALGEFKSKKIGKIKYYISSDEKKVILPAVGHLLTLKKNERFYPVFELIWSPSYRASKSSLFSKPYYNLIKSFQKKAKSVTIATDYDTEGEVIGLNILKHILKKEDAYRMKFSSMTLPELKKSYEQKNNRINWAQANAGLLRHYLDWFYGVNLSQIISKSISSKLNRYQPMSIGRVQGPILAILSEREIEIKNFKPESFLEIFANLWLNKNSIRAIHKDGKFFDKLKAKTIYDKIKDKEGTVSNISKIKREILPPTPFNLTDLQLEAYKLFKYTPSMTLKLAQSLYSSGYISYPRTSSQKLPKSLGYNKIFNKLSRNSNYSMLIKQIKKKLPRQGSKSDPAHPAIYPTGNLPKKINSYELKLFDLIVRRFIATFGETLQRESTNVTLDIESEKFKFNGSRLTIPGWSKIYGKYYLQKELILPKLTVGDVVKQNSSISEGETKPSPRFTPASLIRILDKEGIGTKATRSSIIEILENRKYISGNPIRVTKFGMSVYYTFKKFCPEIISIILTKKLSDSMNDVLESKINKEVVLSSAQNSVTSYYDKLKQNSEKIGSILSDSFQISKSKLTELYPHTCGKMLVIRKSKKTKKRFIACSGYPDCKFTLPLPQKGTISVEKKKCNKCKNTILSTVNRKKKWTFCPNPDCKNNDENSK